MHQVLDWLKSNIAIIVLGVIIVAAPIALWIVSRGMNESVREELQARARGLTELGQIENVQVSFPDTGESVTGVPNERLLEQFRRYYEQRVDDSRTVLEAAIEHNRKDHTVLMPELFPMPPRNYEETYPLHFPSRLANAYYDLLEEVRVGMPPSPAQIAQELDRRERQFRMQILRRDMDELLTAEERDQLDEELRSLRMLRYSERAEMLSYYLNPEHLNIPAADATVPGPLEVRLDRLFEWQWRFWIHSDILKALAAANEADGSVIRGPVKRVVELHVGERFAGGGSPQAISPSTAVGTDYSVSLTGRRSNHLYDVRRVDLRLIVDSSRVYDVIDAISSYNFMTVLNLEMSEADPYQAARAGFYFGSDPVVEISMTVETVWFREWTSERMPESTLQALGIRVARGGEGT